MSGPCQQGLRAVAAALFFLTGCSGESVAPAFEPRGAPEAGYVTVRSEPVTLTTELSGRATARVLAEVRPQVSGIVERRLFDEGDEVEAGQPLYQLDTRLLEAAVKLAEAERASAAADLERAQLDYERYEALRNKQAISQQELDLARAELTTRQAASEAAAAALEEARIRLDYATVRAPTDGFIGRSEVTTGALVTADQPEALATIRQLDPIFVDLRQAYGAFQSLRREAGQLRSGGAAREPLTVTLVDAAGQRYPLQGALQFGDYAVDPKTGTVTLRAQFPNPDGQLLPGMFLRASIERGRDADAILVDQAVIQRDSRGQPAALVIGEGDTVSRRPLTLGDNVGNRWLVTDGLTPGDRLIVDGFQQVQEGQAVIPVAVGATVAGAPPGAVQSDRKS
ncbi:MAG TPA: efflux transporter periplasmic adaptor subunit [Halieaceae bacterium]|nr:efflux transporter periplasmic adaptor subunit [Halieaceae bacterium]